ncbi:MAG: hypothetical protein COV99_07470 [Bacteroidetes bacterium CG12_big_fil_rev_8_21_14_0_65_60_17]|nr:MAG: hypothetical protein COV99_07470 [Bacteroidetes bacterium CG12_big_fil_rev_8_21_14_0_65_60_17]
MLRLIFASACLLFTTSALAQPAGSDAWPRAAPEDVATIDAIITAYYDVISGPAAERADVERDRSLHHEDAWVAIAGSGADGRRTVRYGREQHYALPRRQPLVHHGVDVRSGRGLSTRMDLHDADNRAGTRGA